MIERLHSDNCVLSLQLQEGRFDKTHGNISNNLVLMIVLCLIRCVEVLQDFGREDWQLSATVCKMLCNYSARITSTDDTFGCSEASRLSELLFEYLGKGDRDRKRGRWEGQMKTVDGVLCIVYQCR